MLPTNRLRKLLLPRSTYDGYVLNWNVKVNYWPNREQVFQRMATAFYLNDADLLMQHPSVYDHIDAFLNHDDSFNRVVENMCNGVDDADTYRMFRPKVAERFGLEYKGPGAESPFDVVFRFLGRSGGHLIVEDFEGIKLDRNWDWESDWGSDLWTRQLCAMIVEWDMCFTQQAVREECDYLCAWQVYANIEDGEELAA